MHLIKIPVCENNYQKIHFCLKKTWKFKSERLLTGLHLAREVLSSSNNNKKFCNISIFNTFSYFRYFKQNPISEQKSPKLNMIFKLKTVSKTKRSLSLFLHSSQTFNEKLQPITCPVWKARFHWSHVSEKFHS